MICKIVAYISHESLESFVQLNFMTTRRKQWIQSKLSHNGFSQNHRCWMIRLIHINFIPLLSATARCHVRDRWCGKIIHWGVANWYHSKLLSFFLTLYYRISMIIFRKIIFKSIWNSHYSKSQIFVQKFNFDKTKPQHFHEFFTQKILTIFLVKSKLSTAKKSKTKTFSRVFHPQKIGNFLGKSKWNYWTKNEDFEQCAHRKML